MDQVIRGNAAELLSCLVAENLKVGGVFDLGNLAMVQLTFIAVQLAVTALFGTASAAELRVEVEQVTTGPKHHFFGYIGHVRTIPWNESGRYIVALRTDFQDRMPTSADKADVILIDTSNNDRARVVDQTRAWNFQQGTMLYWNPAKPETQFFFNDRDPATNKTFVVLFDISKGEHGERIREYRYADSPIGNSGVAQNGGYFLGLNYARLARLRPVTGYPGTWDWTAQEKHPENDGIFRVNVDTAAMELIVSFQQLRDAIRRTHPHVDDTALFINHTLWNRDDNRIYFYARGGWEPRIKNRINVPFTIRPDGSDLTQQKVFIGGHPEWESGPRMIGVVDEAQVIYDTDRQEIVDTLGDPAIFPVPGADIALSPDGTWFVNGYREKGHNRYVLFRRSDAAYIRTRSFDQHGQVNGELRNDPAPCWNRDGTQILFPAFADDAEHTRQLFRLRLLPQD